jgi:hypothetical protein
MTDPTILQPDPSVAALRAEVSPPVRFEILDRLRAENHRRHDAQQS